jgi:thiamine pyrophosphate-dependent acetolactate synthase large subunit-like protein
MRKVSDFVVRFIADQGVKHVFLVTGGGAMHLNQSLGACAGIEAVCNSHEQASAMCAESYAKATNGLGVAMVTTGPGGTNAVTGVAGAWLDSTPTLFVSGQVKRPDRMFDSAGKPLGMRQLGVQEVDIVSIVKPITKYAVTVLDPAEIRYEMEKAVHLATTGRPGPVWVDIPLDVQASPIEDASQLRGFDPAEIGTAAALCRQRYSAREGGGRVRRVAQVAADSDRGNMVRGRPGSERRSDLCRAAGIGRRPRRELRPAELRFSAGDRRPPGFRHHRLRAAESRPRSP